MRTRQQATEVKTDMLVSIDIFLKATATLIAKMLKRVLPQVGGPDWWQSCVVAKMSLQQRQCHTKTLIKTLERLDFAVLLCVLDKNWTEIAEKEGYPLGARNLVHEVSEIRNHLAHESNGVPTTDEDLYRDLDTLKRFLTLLKTDADTLSKIDTERSVLLTRLAHPSSQRKPPSTHAAPTVSAVAMMPLTATPPHRSPSEPTSAEVQRHKAEAEFHPTRVKEAIEAEGDLIFIRSSIYCAERDAAHLPDNIRLFATTNLGKGFIVILDCSLYSKPIMDMKAGIDAFLPDIPSHTVDSYLLWLFGQRPVNVTPAAATVTRTLYAEATLPSWLDTFIYEENNATYEPDPRKVQKNLRSTPDDVRWYLGTYFPRSYAELFCITDNLLERMNSAGRLPKTTKMSILDVGCGSGGALMGILWAIRKHRNDIQDLAIVAIDGNHSALETLTSVVKKTQERWIPGIQLKAYKENITTTFPTNMIQGQKFDIVVTSKFLCELSADDTDAYKRFIETYAPHLAENGMLVMLDVPTKSDSETDYNPNRMLTAANNFVRSSHGEFRTILPLSCAWHGERCQQGCFMTKTFVVHTSRNKQVESAVCYHIVARKTLVEALLTSLDSKRDSSYCKQYPNQNASALGEPPFDPFCL